MNHLKNEPQCKKTPQVCKLKMEEKMAFLMTSLMNVRSNDDNEMIRISLPVVVSTSKFQHNFCTAVS